MARTIKLSDETVAFLEKESSLFNRSLSGQAEFLIKLGRSIEQSPGFNYERVRQALNGKISPNDLTDKESIVFSDKFDELMCQPSDQAEEFFAERRKNGLGVGLDEDGNIVYQKDLKQQNGE